MHGPCMANYTLVKRSWISQDLQKHNSSANNPSYIRNNMKYQIEKKQTNNVSLVELLIPTLNESCRYNFLLALLEGENHEQS